MTFSNNARACDPLALAAFPHMFDDLPEEELAAIAGKEVNVSLSPLSLLRTGNDLQCRRT